MVQQKTGARRASQPKQFTAREQAIASQELKLLNHCHSSALFFRLTAAAPTAVVQDIMPARTNSKIILTGKINSRRKNLMKPNKPSALRLLIGVVALGILTLAPQTGARQSTAFNVKDHYVKSERRIEMRDGVKLYTLIYSPKDASQKYPILMTRTPYSVAPYGADAYRSLLGPSSAFTQEGYIFVYQDVRGTFMSEGEFEDVRPHIPNKKSKKDIDESSDTYDTIEWLIKNVPNNNGRVGVYGISYPGFYTATALMEA